jgi:hypothetical protein
MRGFNKYLGGLGILLFFSFGAIAVSVAASSPMPTWFHNQLSLPRTVKDRFPQAQRDMLRSGFVCEEVELPNVSPKPAFRDRDAAKLLIYCPWNLRLGALYLPKVSVQILHSVLNL